ncbi:hypothetical protein [Pseudorhodoferax soli]|uniref:Uncharacterized protein n=1 Tax=Pseudorhodoferax soli TaxID=545864 RepID=A0A368Y806_9BURK|nr:hypothetical protein [Pseudorhodoferax soli]RCW76393.1 hypothetical protein DES41_101999 [Pseudorhodoferax soli]
MRSSLVGLLVVGGMATGCATVSGPQPAVGANGPEKTSSNPGLVNGFYASHAASFAAPGDSSLARKMLEDGFALVDANCRTFFRSAGKSQQNVSVIRDVVGAVGTFGSAILALHEGSRHAAGYLALTTGVAFSGIDIYTKNYLFSAENIDSVRTLVVNALTKHSSAALGIGVQTYSSAALLVLGNQDICEPSSIAALSRDAIRKGDVVAVQTSVEPNSVGLISDQLALQELGNILNPPGRLTLDQAGALWWLLRDFSSSSEKSVIASKLSDLQAAVRPIDAAGNYSASWPHEASVRRALDKFSSQTKNGFTTAIVAARSAAVAANAAAVARAALLPAAPAVVPVLPTPSFGSARPANLAPAQINVMIR